MNIELALDVKAELGEGPLWDAAAERLLFVDIMRGHVHEFDPRTGADRVFEIGEPVSALTPTAKGDVLLATKSGFLRLDRATGTTTRLAFVEADVPDNRMNDAYCDSHGRFWAGTMNMRGRVHGALYRLDPDGRVSRMLTGVSVSNGLDWSLDGTLMYYVDTHTGRIDVFDFDEAAGTIANRRPFVSLPHTAGHPDGLIVDGEGCIWLALWAGSAIHRYTPDGQLDRVIQTPVSHPTKCAFGGADLKDLYFTSAAIELTPEARAANPLAGGLFHCRPGVAGKPTHVFAG